ncbi:MAG: hypothetical protein HKP52_09455 [Desulfofustis sp.]|nr:hypothetical protein [Desulfofustis sp.]
MAKEAVCADESVGMMRGVKNSSFAPLALLTLWYYADPKHTGIFEG